MSVIVLSAEIERISANGVMSKELLTEFEELRVKAVETEACIQALEDRIKRLEHLHNQVVQESMKISEHLHASHKRWNHYDSSMQQMTEFL